MSSDDSDRLALSDHSKFCDQVEAELKRLGVPFRVRYMEYSDWTLPTIEITPTAVGTLCFESYADIVFYFFRPLESGTIIAGISAQSAGSL